jgi:5-hydroxyisourate hydrolase-like protein (transthyretin family)
MDGRPPILPCRCWKGTKSACGRDSGANAWFVRGEIIEPILGKKTTRAYLPYLLTVFFFILFCNLFGLVPFGASATGNTISANSVFDNSGLGIDLGNDGVTPNDADDSDTGPNNLQNFPSIDTAESDGSSTTVSGSLTSSSNTDFTLEFFANAVCDPTGFGEGEEFLGSTDVTTGDEGSASFAESFSVPVAAAGFVTATATNRGSGDTSEFSACAEVSPAEPIPTPTEAPEPEATEVSFTENSATSAQYTDEVLFEAKLIDSQGDPIEGVTLTFELTGEESSRDFTASTDQDGVASVTPTLEEKPGPYQLTVRYAGDEERSASADTTTFVVERKDTATKLTVQGQGQTMTLRARLSHLDSSSDRVASRPISFYSDGELLGWEQTDADGIAEVPVSPGHRGANRTYEAIFEGDDFYAPSSDERPGRRGGQGDAVGGSASKYPRLFLGGWVQPV